MPSGCDNASVGVLIADDRGRYLMFDRNTPPEGCAPCAGHVFDEHTGYTDAARAEVAEELGLNAGRLTPLPAAVPGIEPVWVAFLAGLHLITMNPGDLEAIEHVARHGEPPLVIT